MVLDHLVAMGVCSDGVNQMWLGFIAIVMDTVPSREKEREREGNESLASGA